MRYAGLVKSLRVPPGFTAPTVLEFEDLRATVLGRADLADDVRGINASLELIRRTRGGGWPTEPVTEEVDFVDYWRLISTGFLHVELLAHRGLNMLALYWLGRMIEPALGHARFVAIYLTSLLTGSLLVLILAPNVKRRWAPQVRSTACSGAAIVMARNRDHRPHPVRPVADPRAELRHHAPRSGFSLAAHVGGLVGGLVVTFVVEELAKRRRTSTVPAVAFCALVSVAGRSPARSTSPC